MNNLIFVGMFVLSVQYTWDRDMSICSSMKCTFLHRNSLQEAV